MSPTTAERSLWNPLNYIKVSCDTDLESKAEQGKNFFEESLQPIVTKGRIILYTRLGCQDCREVRLFLQRKRLMHVEINIDVYPSRKLELEKFSRSFTVPKVFFNEVLIGGLSELKDLDESGKLDEKIDFLVAEAPSTEAPLPPLSGEDDVSNDGSVDELALIVQKMKATIVVKDRLYKMRRFTNCFLGSEAVDFLSEDQYLEREEAVEFGQKLASELFFRHVLDENLFEDGDHLYRFLDHDPTVSSHCHNIPSAYASKDGRHVDYKSINGSEEFARYLRIVQELQRVKVQDMPREEKLAFFINLYNMMAIHAILAWGHPAGPLERRKLLETSSMLVGVALPYPEPLVHFALVSGARSGPALRCYSPGNIDKELMDAARDFLRAGGLIVDLNGKVAYASKILKWFSVDFGKTVLEVLKHASNYLEPSESEALLEMIADGELKVIYQPYDWRLNC
ncbi:putative Glycerol-3-phosphate acyltransferase [Hibiscus syriacus]|uniref:Glycerol-3-phosphate acyltransferase n=1 Tax=Hibiscus syriacus TaxID=106335 RepID=A0A6A3BEI3_HIBSY|nr:putative Glycerol-3-phosphate acyltransferase [Hibiscus syriacus]